MSSETDRLLENEDKFQRFYKSNSMVSLSQMSVFPR